jgi:hypothetical protein
MANEQIDFYEHPEFKAKQDSWETYRALYEGIHSVLCQLKYLWAHDLEAVPGHGAKLRARREQRSRYFNLMEAIVSNWTSLCFKNDPQIDPSVQALFGDDWQNVDGNGSDFMTFLKGPVFTAYVRDGRPIVLTDAYDLDEVTSLGQQNALGHRAFFEVLDVLEFKDWERESRDSKRFGKFNSFRYEYEAIAPRMSLIEKPQCVKYCRVYQKEAVGYTVQTFRQEGEGDSATWTIEGAPQVVEQLDELPISAIMNGDSWVKDVSELCLVLFNLMSAYYSQLNNQAYQRIIIAGDLNEENMMALTEFSITRVPKDSNVHTIEPSNTAALEGAIERTVDQIYKVAFNQTKRLASTSNEAPGADTLREMKDELVAFLKSALAEIENLANHMIQQYAAFKTGNKNFEGKITLDKNITVEDIDQQVRLFQAFADDLKPIESVRKAVLKKAVQQMNLPDAEKLQKDIEAHDYSGVDATKQAQAREALMGQFGGEKKDPAQDDSEEGPKAGTDPEDQAA